MGKNSVSREAIPQETKKIVRQRCGYGCVICGAPLYHYDHMIEYSKVNNHNSDNITLLCGDHHDKKTRGILPIETIIDANSKPFAIYDPLSLKEKLYFKSNSLTIKIASNELYVRTRDGDFISPFIIYNRTPFYFDIENGQLLLSGEFKDENDQPLLLIDKNEIQFRTQEFDIERVGSKIIIRKGKGNIILCINTNPASSIIDIETAIFMVNDISVKLVKKKLKIVNSKLGIKYATVSNCGNSGNVGFSIHSPNWIGRIYTMI